jgi:hypothetical protein
MHHVSDELLQAAPKIVRIRRLEVELRLVHERDECLLELNICFRRLLFDY